METQKILKVNNKLFIKTVVVLIGVVVTAFLCTVFKDASENAWRVSKAIQAWEANDLHATNTRWARELLARLGWLDPPRDPLKACGIRAETSWWSLLARSRETRRVLNCLEEQVHMAEEEHKAFRRNLLCVVVLCFVLTLGLFVKRLLVARIWAKTKIHTQGEGKDPGQDNDKDDEQEKVTPPECVSVPEEPQASMELPASPPEKYEEEQGTLCTDECEAQPASPPLPPVQESEVQPASPPSPIQECEAQPASAPFPLQECEVQPASAPPVQECEAQPVSPSLPPVQECEVQPGSAPSPLQESEVQPASPPPPVQECEGQPASPPPPPPVQECEVQPASLTPPPVQECEVQPASLTPPPVQECEVQSASPPPPPVQECEAQTATLTPPPVQECEVQPASLTPPPVQESDVQPASPPSPVEECEVQPASPPPLSVRESESQPALPPPLPVQESEAQPASPPPLLVQESEALPTYPLSPPPPVQESEAQPASPAPLPVQESEAQPASVPRPSPEQEEAVAGVWQLVGRRQKERKTAISAAKEEKPKPVVASKPPQGKSHAKVAARRHNLSLEAPTATVRQSWSEDIVQVFLTVASNRLRHVVGPRGDTIRQLRKDYPAVHMTVPLPQDSESSQVVLKGPKSQVASAARDITAHLKDIEDQIREAARHRQEGKATVVLEVAPNMRGHVIGPGGETLIKLRQEYPGVKVTVPPVSNAQAQSVTLRGPQDEVAAVAECITARLQAVKRQRQLRKARKQAAKASGKT